MISSLSNHTPVLWSSNDEFFIESHVRPLPSARPHAECGGGGAERCEDTEDVPTHTEVVPHTKVVAGDVEMWR